MSRRAACSVWAFAMACSAGLGVASGVMPEGAPAYDVPQQCPTRAQWLEALRARLPLLLRTHPLVEAQRVHVERVAGNAYEGYLDSPAESAAPGRTVRGATCAEVIDVLSFMSALGLHRISGEPPSTAPPGPPAPAAVEPLAPVGADRATGGGDGAAPSALRAGATAFVLLQKGVTPEPSLDFGVGGRLEWSAPGWQPLLLFGVYAGRAQEVSVDGAAKVRFEHWSTHAVACPWRFPSQGAVALRPCVDFDLGVLRGTGSGVAEAEAHTAPWVSGGGQLRFDVALGNRLELGALLGVNKPLYRARFFVRPSSTAFETENFGLRTGTYATIRF